MEIDIIDLTANEYKTLNGAQLALVRIAQLRKNKILGQASLDKAAAIRKLADHNFVRSTIYTAEQERIDAEAAEKIEILKNDLLYQISNKKLQSTGASGTTYAYPYNPNYNLSDSERYTVVKNYYMTYMNDPNARLEAYKTDTLARAYLGEYYQTLYSYLASYCN